MKKLLLLNVVSSWTLALNLGKSLRQQNLKLAVDPAGGA